MVFEGGKISNKTDTGRSPAPVGHFKNIKKRNDEV